MMVMFSKNDGIGASGMVAARGVIRYMTAHSFSKTVDGQKIVEDRNPPPEILKGDPDLMAAAIAGVPFERRYVSAVLSFAAGDVDMDVWNSGNPALRATIGKLIQNFEDTMFAGIEPGGRPPTYWTTHRHSGRLELNFVSPRAILVGDQLKSININPPVNEQRRLCDCLRDVWNSRMGWADPEDPSRARGVKVPDYIQRIDALRQRRGEASKTDIRKEIADVVSDRISSGELNSRSDVLEFLGQHAEITRAGDDYVSIKWPGADRAIRLKGPMFSASFTSPAGLPKCDQAQPGRVIDLAAAEGRLADLTRRRAEFNFGRYQTKIDKASGFDRANPFAEQAEFTVTDGPIVPPSHAYGPGRAECSGEDRRLGKARVWRSLYGSTVPEDILAEIRFIRPGERPSVSLSDGSRVVDHGDRLTCRPATDLSIRLMLAEAQAKGWTSASFQGSPEFRARAGLAFAEAGISLADVDLKHIQNAIRQSKARGAEPPPSSPISEKFQSKVPHTMDSDSSFDLVPTPRPKPRPEAEYFIRQVAQGPRPMPTRPVDFDSGNVIQLYLRQHFGQPFPSDQLENVRFVRRMREVGGVDITLASGQVIADRDDGNLVLTKGEIDQKAAESMVFMAAQKGWTEIDINPAASPEFRQAIIAASAAQGVEIAGLSAEERGVYDAATRQVEEAERPQGSQSVADLANELIRLTSMPATPSAAALKDAGRDRNSDFDIDMGI